MFHLVGQNLVFLLTILQKFPVHIISKVGLPYDVGYFSSRHIMNTHS